MRPLDPTRPHETARQRAERESGTVAEVRDEPSAMNAALEAVAGAPSDGHQVEQFEPVPAPRKKAAKSKKAKR